MQKYKRNGRLRRRQIEGTEKVKQISVEAKMSRTREKRGREVRVRGQGENWREMGKRKENQSPKGIMRSAVPLPCFFDVVKSQKVAGQWPQQGRKSCRMGSNFILPSIHPFIHLLIILGI